MNKNLAAIRKLARYASERRWAVDVAHKDDRRKRFFTIPWFLSSGDWSKNLNFEKDADAAYLVAAAVTTAGPMAAALQQLEDLANAAPLDAPEEVKLFVRAIQNAVGTIPPVEEKPED